MQTGKPAKTGIREAGMASTSHLMIAVVGAFVLLAGTASAQKRGGILRQYILDSPASMSIHEETTVVGQRPMMAVFNNLVMFDQHIPQNSLASIVPDLATDWAWNGDGTRLTFHLRQGVKWHDGKPFTAADIKCTWDLVRGKAAEKLRINPRKSWYNNLADIIATSDHEVTFC
jgi:peptide/nickel transport system substrate-binding protein